MICIKHIITFHLSELKREKQIFLKFIALHSLDNIAFYHNNRPVSDLFTRYFKSCIPQVPIFVSI